MLSSFILGLCGLCLLFINLLYRQSLSPTALVFGELLLSGFAIINTTLMSSLTLQLSLCSNPCLFL